MAERIALIIGNHSFQDKILAGLNRPEVDLNDLAAVLRDPKMGNFDAVEVVVDEPAREICRRIEALFYRKQRHDLILLYLVGHGLLDRAGQLYLATVDTRCESPGSTALPAAYLTQQMDRSFARQKILIIDGYYSRFCQPGIVARPGGRVDVARAFEGSGTGRVVLSGADTTQYVIAGEQVLGQAVTSVFSQYLIQGLRTGVADADRDGQIGLDELYNYIRDQVVQQPGRPKPGKWTYHEQDRFIIARNPNDLKPERFIKWDLIAGAILAPITTIIIGGWSDLRTAVGMAGLLLMLYALLYWTLD